MTDTVSPTRTVYVRDCRHCRTEIEHGYTSTCPECGWRMGLKPVAESHDDDGNLATLFVAALIVLAVVWRETRFGRVTYGLTPGMRALTKVVLAVGGVLMFCTVIGWKGGDRLMGR